MKKAQRKQIAKRIVIEITPSSLNLQSHKKVAIVLKPVLKTPS